MAADRKQVPERDREVIAQVVREMLDERDAHGRRKWSQHSLGEAIGLSQEAVRKAQTSAGVIPAIRDGIVRLKGKSVEELAHEAKVNESGMIPAATDRRPASTNASLTPEATRWEAMRLLVELDGVTPNVAHEIVSALRHEPNDGPLAFYEKARRVLADSPDVKAHPSVPPQARAEFEQFEQLAELPGKPKGRPGPKRLKP
jgi:hypothetical protein